MTPDTVLRIKILFILPERLKKIPLPIQDFNEALTYAEDELRVEWEFFKMNYLMEVGHE